MKKHILQYPNPLLGKRSLAVEDFNEETLRDIEDLVDTMRASPGVGLAAVQIGILKRIIVVDVTPPPTKKGKKKTTDGTLHGMIILVNPTIVSSVGEHMVREGCLSIPEYTADIRRAKEITITGLDEDGNVVTIESSGFEAVALQHEVDHTDGILFIDRIESVRSLFKRKVKESAKESPKESAQKSKDK